MSAFIVRIRDNQGTPQDRGDLGPEAVGVKVSSILPGGCERLSFRIYRPIHVIPSEFGFNFDVTVSDSIGVFWAGRMEDFKAHRGPDGEYWDVTVVGYGVNADDQLYTSQDVSNTQTSTIVDNALSSLAPQIGTRTVTATGVTLSAATSVTLKMMTAAKVLNWASKFGDSGNNPQIWKVYPEDDGDIVATFGPRPTTPDLFIASKDMAVVEFGLKGRQLADRVTVEYNGGSSTVTVNDTDLQAAGPNGWDLVKTAYLVIHEITQAADATAAANTFLNAISVARMAATSLQLNKNALITDANGQAVAPWRVRAGMLLKLTDVESAEGQLTNLAWSNTALLARTEWDEDRQYLSLTPESLDLSLDLATARVRALLTGRHTT